MGDDTPRDDQRGLGSVRQRDFRTRFFYGGPEALGFVVRFFRPRGRPHAGAGFFRQLRQPGKQRVDSAKLERLQDCLGAHCGFARRRVSFIQRASGLLQLNRVGLAGQSPARIVKLQKHLGRRPGAAVKRVARNRGSDKLSVLADLLEVDLLGHKNIVGRLHAVFGDRQQVARSG